MSLFLAVHRITPHVSPDEAARLVYGVISHLRPDTQWLKYWLCDDEGKMICLWSASGADAVRAAGVPTSDVFCVEEGDPTLLMQGLNA